MTGNIFSRKTPMMMLLGGGILLGGCGDISLDSIRDRLDPVPGTRTAATLARPKADARGVITYPNYQVIVAKQGDSMADIAGRVGMSAQALAEHNGLSVSYKPRNGEVLALPKGIIIPTERSDVQTDSLADIASAAIARGGAGNDPQVGVIQPGPEPIRHTVEPGETAYSIARLYGVSVTSLASWNGLDRDLSLRSGQRLLIPVVEDGTPAESMAPEEPLPGTGSETPLPPTSKKPLPEDVEETVIPDSPDLSTDRTPPGASRKLLKPVNGSILRGYSSAPGGNEGLDISAPAGTAVKAAEDGEVALISKTDSGTIILLRHPDNLYTVYSNVDGETVSKGQTVRRGQTIAKVAKGAPSFLHFEVRRGTESVDPARYL